MREVERHATPGELDSAKAPSTTTLSRWLPSGATSKIGFNVSYRSREVALLGRSNVKDGARLRAIDRRER
jgi:hypothetical protein